MESIKIIAEYSGRNWAAYSENLEGVYATGATLDALCREFVEAAKFHVDGLAEDGLPIPAVDLSTYVVFPIVYVQSLGKLRKSLGLTQADVANEISSTQSRVSEIERNPLAVSFGNVRKYLQLLEEKSGSPALNLVADPAHSKLVAS